MTRPFLLAWLGALALSVAAGASCGDEALKATGTTTGTGGTGGAVTGTGGAADAGHEAAGPTYPAPFEAPPQVRFYGGPVMASPRLVPVFFAGDDASFTAQLADFVSKVGSTPYFTAAVGEYGVGPATALPPVQLAETAPASIDDGEIQAWLQGKLNGEDPAWPANDANTLYLLHYPAGTTITLQGQKSCSSFGGYHSDTQLDLAHGDVDVAYAVIPRCSGFGSLMGIDAVTGAESHEIAEAVTDPNPIDDPAYATVDDAHVYWQRVLGGGEVGDLCAQFPGAFTKFAGLDYTVQRIWSNKSAKAGRDPCQPEMPGEVYFNASPVMTDDVAVNIGGVITMVKGVEIPLGQSKTIEVELFSEAATSGAWTVTAENSPPQSQNLGFSLDQGTGQNGDKLMLTITVNMAGKRGSETFILKSSLDGQDNLWIGVVGTPVTNDGGVEGGFGDGGAGDGGTDDGGAADDGGTDDGGAGEGGDGG
jgi:hypothetical protein